MDTSKLPGMQEMLKARFRRSYIPHGAEKFFTKTFYTLRLCGEFNTLWTDTN